METATLSHVLIAASLPHVLLALPTRPNYPLLRVPIFKINCNLYTFYHVLGVLRQEFSPTLRDKLPTDFAVLDTLRVHLDLTANLLLGQYLPRALARTLQEQWGMETLRTEIPPEGVLELAIQCIASSLLPGTRFTLPSIQRILNQHFRPAFQRPLYGERNVGTPRIIFLALNQPSAPAAPLHDPNTKYFVGGSNLRFPRVFPNFVYEAHRERRVEAMKEIQGTRALRRRLVIASNLAGITGANNVTLVQAQGMRANLTAGTCTHDGQAYEIPGFSLRNPCVECFAIYRNSFVGIPGSYVNRLYDCGEDSWILEVRGKSDNSW